MPPLPKGLALRAKDHKTERLLEILRGIAVTNQREEPQPFYPLRDVASQFQVPVSTVARVYGQLEDEGILPLLGPVWAPSSHCVVIGASV